MNYPAVLDWHIPAHGDEEIKSNRPDIIVMSVIKDEVLKKCLLIDIAIPAEWNTSGKMFEKLSKYEIKISMMWDISACSYLSIGLVQKGLGK